MTATVHQFKSRAQLKQEAFEAKIAAVRFTVDVDHDTLCILAGAAKHFGVSEFDLLRDLIHRELEGAHDEYWAAKFSGNDLGAG